MPNYSERIGEGGEKIVYPDPIDPEKKVRIELKRGARDNAQTTGRYYLQKITHLLFPENTPNIYFAGTKPIGNLRMQRASVDPVHEEMQSIIINGAYSDNETKKLNQLQRETAENPKVQALIKNFQDSGLYIDINGRNFAFNEKGEAQYLDSHTPWDLNRDGTIDSENFNESNLLKAILRLPEQRQTKALKYFNRLIILKQQIMEKTIQP
jgi:hypothetical protein